MFYNMIIEVNSNHFQSLPNRELKIIALIPKLLNKIIEQSVI